MSVPTLLLHITPQDVPYLNLIKPLLVGRSNTRLDSTIPSTYTEILMSAKKAGTNLVVSTSSTLLEKLLPDAVEKTKTKRLSLNDYAGSIIKKNEVEFLFINPLENIISTTTGKFITSRFLDKFLKPDNWISSIPFLWELFDPSKVEELTEFFSVCDLIAIDIETIRDDPDKAIECISFTGAMIGKGECCVRTVVVPFDSLFNVIFVRNVCANSAPKCLQNGKYDVAYLLRNNAPISNYILDTINLFHSWLCELPKDLGFISSMMVRNYCFHKDEGSYGGKYDRFSYNAKDTYYTLLGTLALLLELPDYAWTNYYQEFPLTYPCILSEHTGLKIDPVRFVELKEKVEDQLEKQLGRLRTRLASPHFNPSSYKQVESLFKLLGSGDIKGTKPPQMDKVSSRHPLNKLLLSDITSYREDRKLNGSYFKETVDWLGRCFYALNPSGTDTGRLASRESHFWCGLQIQNIPRDDEEGVSFKEVFVSDPGFYYGEADFSQAEARGTAYISGDINLIAAVEDKTKDFHGFNASKFFGVPYEEIVQSRYDEKTLQWIHKTINKALRDLAKKTNHGANYNMGPAVMLDTMGIAAVIRAKQLLKLPQSWSLIKVTTHLLDVYAETYPTVKGPWYDSIKAAVNSSGYLVGATDWTRKCFGNPSSNKRDLNSYVAHPPQSLNAMLLNKAYNRVFNEIWLPNSQNFKLCAQIHDSILFQYRIGYEFLAHKVKECMHIPIEVTDTFGIKRTMIVPVDLKGGATRWSDLVPL